jgi:DeoR family transcriptional regulator, suf operon transcriptional repressor
MSREKRGMGDLSGTAAELLAYLCAEPETAAQLAARVGISRAAVRVHLTQMESDGLVTRAAQRGRVGKPSHIYSISELGQLLLSRAYPPVLRYLVEAILQSDGESALEERMRDVGRRLAVDAVSRGDSATPIENATATLGLLGAIVRIDETDAGTELRAACCPLSSLTRDRPAVCKLMETMLATLLDAPVRERCERSATPVCHFQIRSR